jgi:hypothetical protein
MRTLSTVRKQEKQEIRAWEINKNETANTTIFKYHYLSHSTPTSKPFYFAGRATSGLDGEHSRSRA